MSSSYQSPFSSRYCDASMLNLFSEQTKFSTWRSLWILLAQGQQKLGLNISQQQIDQLVEFKDKIPFERARELEKQTRHDVMAHILAYSEQAPLAKPIIHLGATSCFVTDNADLIIQKKALDIIQKQIIHINKLLVEQAKKYSDTPCLSFTHFQAAQPTTFGKRVCLWLQDFLIDMEEISNRFSSLKLLGIKGTTGTQASFLHLFKNDFDQVQKLDHYLAKETGFEEHLFAVSGQTYTRKQDILLLDALASFAATAHKFATDIRLLSHLGELEEPIETNQVGSSAMPYKRNPILSERICGLSRFLISLKDNASYTAALQWLERSLDDSSNRRLSIPEAFLCANAIGNLILKIISRWSIYPKVMLKNLEKEAPFLCAEEILMQLTKQGGDRQDLHEKLRSLCFKESVLLKEGAKNNLLLEKIAADSSFSLSLKELQNMILPEKLTGASKFQVDFFSREVDIFLSRFKDWETVIPNLTI